ncbi:compass component bre2 [Cryptococcus deuterogattii 2001/935-1]|nr:compass component bre2 [Cryptococcus deuterogattii 2001/935-1]
MSLENGLAPPLSRSETPALGTVGATLENSTISLSLPDQNFLGEGLAGPGPSTTESHTKKIIREDVERRQYARMGTIMPGTGDGLELGEECFSWTDIPSVKNFRYHPCALSPTPSPHPMYPFYRTIPYPPPIPPVHLSLLDRSSYLRISPSLLTIYNDRGFRSCRANVSVREGTWYYEVHIDRGDGEQGARRGTGGEGGNPHVRLGWGRREANLDTPVGCDAYSYAIRDVGGEKVHISRPKPYANKGFKTGDVVGCLITLPPRPSVEDKPPSDPARIKRQRRAFNYKNQAYFESAEYTPSKEMDALIDRDGKLAAAAKAESQAQEANGGDMPKKQMGAATKNTKKGKRKPEKAPEPVARKLEKLSSSSISFFINGECFGEAFTDLYDFTPLPSPYPPAGGHGRKHHPGDEVLHDDGTLGYYPMVSCFGRAKATCNFGPDFTHPLPEGARPMCERYAEFKEEERLQDEKDEIEDAERLCQILEAEKKMLSKVKHRAQKVNPATASRENTPKRKKGPAPKRKREGRDGTEMSTPGLESVRGLTATPAPEVPMSEAGTEWREGSRERSMSVAASLGGQGWGTVKEEMSNEREEKKIKKDEEVEVKQENGGDNEDREFEGINW